MKELRINFLENNIVEYVIKPCRKGKFIFIVCSNNSQRIQIKKIFKKFRISNKRGIWSWRGIIVVTTKDYNDCFSYFDIVIHLIGDKKSERA